MKKNNYFLFQGRWLVHWLLMLLILPGLSCKKRLFDYRNEFVGDWQFTVSEPTLIGDTAFENIEYDSDGEIYYKGKGKDIFIKYNEERFITVTVSEDGTIEDPLYFGSINDQQMTLAPIPGDGLYLSGTKK